jgi:hypothetical protein
MFYYGIADPSRKAGCSQHTPGLFPAWSIFDFRPKAVKAEGPEPGVWKILVMEALA